MIPSIESIAYVYKKSFLGIYSERNVNDSDRTNPVLCVNTSFYILSILYILTLFAFSKVGKYLINLPGASVISSQTSLLSLSLVYRCIVKY